jgi:hypothetical protein
MAQKTIVIDSVGEVLLVKRRGQKNIRISLADGRVRVSQPAWLPFSAGAGFAHTKRDWIRAHRTHISKVFSDGQTIGKDHVLRISFGDTKTSRIKGGVVDVTLEYGKNVLAPSEQAYTARAVARALRNEAEKYLPGRTEELASRHNFSYKSISIKSLKRRWGSCNSKKELVFNLHLMSLPYDQIDYVILHELTHTLHMNHSADFWESMESVLPDAKDYARTVRKAQI